MNFEFEDFRPPDKRPPNNKLLIKDYIMIVIMTYVIGMSVIYNDWFNFLLGIVAWRLYEINRTKK